jgi:hypothetical protein
MLWFANEPLEAHPKAFVLVCVGATGLLIGELALVGAADAELHASLEPQASVLVQPLKVFVGGCV